MLLIWICPILRLWGVMKSYNKRALKLLNATTLKNAFHP
ncbi:hypothetical protein HPHPH34_0345 [Helicobacter pylori Hp H-34]|uniref:Uncharacterized protein n=1 Tax=Helicobacter pylori Hp H-34 TaxID=992069 RepID=I9VVR0_HELPX|nr:hypothetical protein HPHPH34_0345 [Helicobacter pylori Hp H-34]